MPRGEELKPPLKMFGIQAKRLVPFANTLEQIDHAVQKSTWPINFSEMKEMTNEELQLVPGTLMSITPRLNTLGTKLVHGKASHLGH